MAPEIAKYTGEENQQEIEMNLDYGQEFLPDDLGEFGLSHFDSSDMQMGSKCGDEKDMLWLRNYIRNRRYFGLENMVPTPKTNAGRLKVIVLVGGSPAIKNNYTALYGAAEHPGFIIVACNTVLKFLMDNDIKPDYVFLVEGLEHVHKDFNGVDTRDLTLIHSPFAAPKALAKWKGEHFWYLQGGGTRFNEMLAVDWSHRHDLLDIGGGNVISTAMCWAYRYLASRDFVFTGMSLCYYDGKYYHDGREKPNEDYMSQYSNWFKAVDMYGQIVGTTPTLTMYKTWLEAFTKAVPGSYSNCTEDGILGVTPVPLKKNEDGSIAMRAQYLPWWNIVPLRMAIEAYRINLMEMEKDGTWI